MFLIEPSPWAAIGPSTSPAKSILRRSARAPRLRSHSRRDDHGRKARMVSTFLQTLRPHCDSSAVPIHDTDAVTSFGKNINKWPLSGSCRSTSRTRAIKLSGPLRPSTGCVATNRRTLGGRLSTHEPALILPADEQVRTGRRTERPAPQCPR